MWLKNYFRIVLWCSLFLFVEFKTQAQEKQQIKIESKNSYAEKIYLQPVSTVFTTDKTIWFKAIVTDLEHLPTKLSAVLHVDLIDFDEKIIDSKLLKIENGITDGYFDLNEKLPSGRYLIRAYTEWNKNFDNDFMSQTYVDIYAPKEIKKEDQAIREITLQKTQNKQYEISAKAYPELLNPKFKGKLKMYIHTENKTDSLKIKKDKNNSYSFTHLLPKDAVKARLEFQLDSVYIRNFDYKKFNSYSKTVTVDKEYLDLQFFPEGGKLVDELTSKLAFKALDYNNKGKQVIGKIVDEQNNLITSFKSNVLGMGTTQFTPNIQNTYYGIIKGTDGIEYKYALPNINKTGIVLSIKEIEEFIIIGLKTKNTAEDIYNVKVQAHGIEHDNFYVLFKNGSCSAGLEKNKLPEGIIKFTVTNNVNQIVAERLFLNIKKEERINITTSLNKPAYKQRDKTILTLNTTDKSENSIPTNISVLIVNKEQLGNENNLRSNILSYFLLNSELRGTIEKPNEYFNPKNKTREQDLDALLLTQGWSNYKYENTELNIDFKFLPEKGLTISGKVKNQWKSKKELKKPVELTAIYGPLSVATQQIDSTGIFKMALKDYYKNKFKVMLQTKSKKGKKKDYTIELDKYNSPEINYKKEETVQLADSVSIYLKENIVRTQKEEKIKLAAGTVELEEVELTGYRMTPARQIIQEKYGLPDLVIENEELIAKAPSWHYGLPSIIESAFPDEGIWFPDGTKQYEEEEVKDNEIYEYLYSRQIGVYGYDCTYLLIDGKPASILLKTIPIEEIKSFELIKSPDFNTKTVWDVIPDITCTRTAIFNIYTYTGKGSNFISRNKGIEVYSTQGFTPKREFYAPKYGNTDINDLNIPDLRSVVHWSPNVNTNENGEAKVEFYNADNTGEMLIVIEGMTEKGKFGYYETSYQVDEK